MLDVLFSFVLGLGSFSISTACERVGRCLIHRLGNLLGSCSVFSIFKHTHWTIPDDCTCSFNEPNELINSWLSNIFIVFGELSDDDFSPFKALLSCFNGEIATHQDDVSFFLERFNQWHFSLKFASAKNDKNWRSEERRVGKECRSRWS